MAPSTLPGILMNIPTFKTVFGLYECPLGTASTSILLFFKQNQSMISLLCGKPGPLLLIDSAMHSSETRSEWKYTSQSSVNTNCHLIFELCDWKWQFVFCRMRQREVILAYLLIKQLNTLNENFICGQTFKYMIKLICQNIELMSG